MARTKMYKVMINNKQMGDVHYYECDAIRKAELVTICTNHPVEIWEGEKLKGVPYDTLEWTMHMRLEAY